MYGGKRIGRAIMKCLEDYATLIFDCDGVILNSNHIKTEAFYSSALPYGEAAAQALMDHHINNGGISRYEKFSYFLDKITPIHSPAIKGPDMDSLLADYAERVRKGLLTCQVADGLIDLRKKTQGTCWMVVSGGDQLELHEIFKLRGLSEMFDGGIFGSPDTKDQILSRELAYNSGPALFIGDSKYDYQAAARQKLDFVFLWGMTEVKNYKSWCHAEGILTVRDISELARFATAKKP